MFKRFLLGLLLIAVALPAVASHLAKLVEPASIPVPGGLTPDAERQAVLDALKVRRWVAESEAEGKLVAVQMTRDLVVKVTIAYDPKAVTITYLDSTNMDYSVRTNGERLIHQNYNKWINYLVGDIQGKLTLASMSATTTIAAPAPAAGSPAH